MAQDIRKMLQECPLEKGELPKGHEARFVARLETAFSEKGKSSFPWIKIAAIAVVFLAVGFFGYHYMSENDKVEIADASPVEKTQESQFTLGDVSPKLKQVEDFYLTGINVQLASLDINQENKELIDGYMERLSELDNEYTRLNTELNKVGPTEATITALIDNLKLRLDLLFKLKNKLKELKN